MNSILHLLHHLFHAAQWAAPVWRVLFRRLSTWLDGRETMPIPNMPSTCNVYRSWANPVLRHADVPCRVVPRWWGGRRREDSPAALQFTHFIDLPRVADMVAALAAVSLTTTSFVVNTPDASYLEVPSHAPRQFFLVLAVEDRYVDTPDVHMRVYVQQRFRG